MADTTHVSTTRREQQTLGRAAADDMADFLSEKFGTIITPDAVDSILRDYWERLSLWAHRIHNGQYATDKLRSEPEEF